MLKLTASYSKKIPAESDFSSQSYHCTIEVEIPDGTNGPDLQRRIHDTFGLVRSSVEAELHGAPQRPALPPANNRTQNNPTQRSNGPKASAKQIKYVYDLASMKNVDIQDLAAYVRDRYGVDELRDLGKQQASDLIDYLNQDRAA